MSQMGHEPSFRQGCSMSAVAERGRDCTIRALFLPERIHHCSIAGWLRFFKFARSTRRIFNQHPPGSGLELPICSNARPGPSLELTLTLILRVCTSVHTPPAQESKVINAPLMASIGDENAGCAPAQFEQGAAPCLEGVVSNKTYRFSTGWPRGLRKSASKPRNSHLVPNGTPSSRKHVGLIPRPT